MLAEDPKKRDCGKHTRIVVSPIWIGIHDSAKTCQAGARDNGSAVDPGSLRHPRDSGSLSKTESSRVYNDSNDRLPYGGEERSSAGQEDQPCAYLRGRDIAKRGPEPFD